MNNFLESQDPMSKGAGYYNPLLTEAQDATALEMASYNNQPMSKEDFSILSTSQDGIINTLNVLSDEISRHTSIIINKINEVRDELAPKKEQGNGKKKEYSCFTCGEKGHFSPNCPNKDQYRDNSIQEKKNKKILTCYTCGKPGHFSPNCPENDQKEEKKKESAKTTGCFICKQEDHWMKDCPDREEYYKNKYKGKEEYYKNKDTGKKHGQEAAALLDEYMEDESDKENIAPYKQPNKKNKKEKKPRKEHSKKKGKQNEEDMHVDEDDETYSCC